MNNPKKLDEVLNTLSTRSQNCLAAAGILTIEQLIENNRLDLKKFRSLEKKYYVEITELVDSLSLEFVKKKKKRTSIRMTPELFQILTLIRESDGTFSSILPLIQKLKSAL